MEICSKAYHGLIFSYVLLWSIVEVTQNARIVFDQFKISCQNNGNESTSVKCVLISEEKSFETEIANTIYRMLYSVRGSRTVSVLYCRLYSPSTARYIVPWKQETILRPLLIADGFSPPTLINNVRYLSQLLTCALLYLFYSAVS